MVVLRGGLRRDSAASQPAPQVSSPFQAKPYLSAEQMLDLPDSEIDYGIAALVLTRAYVRGYDVAQGVRKLDEIAARVRALLAQQPDGDDPEVRIAAINTVLYREYGFTYDLENFPHQSPDKRLLGNLLRRGKGTCANLPDLYYAVAERLGFPIHMVEAPQHAFLRYVLPDGQYINIEATASGGGSSDEDYIAEMEIQKEAIESGSMMRTLSRREALLLLIAEATWHDERRGDFEAVLARAALLRRLRPDHAATFWNSAVHEANKGRALRELAKSEPVAANAAADSFARAREFARRAVALGITKPDNSGQYARRQEAIRLARTGEPGRLPPSPEKWDAMADLERLIVTPHEGDGEHLVAYRRPVTLRPRALTPGEFADAFEREQKSMREGRLPPDQDRDPRVQEALDRADAVNALNRGARGPSAGNPAYVGLPPTTRDALEFADSVNQYSQTVGQRKMEALQQLVGPGVPLPPVPRSTNGQGGPR